MLRSSVLLLALVFNAPVIWQALGPQTINVDQAVIRFLITVPIVGILLGLIRIAGTHHDHPGDHGARAQRTGVDHRSGT